MASGLAVRAKQPERARCVETCSQRRIVEFVHAEVISREGRKCVTGRCRRFTATRKVG